MNFAKIFSIVGKPGLYELVTTKSDGAIVKSIDIKQSFFIANRTNAISQLKTIEVYVKGNKTIELEEIFKAMEAHHTETLPDVKNDADINTYFTKVYPSLDDKKVKQKDKMKMVQWFQLMQKNGMSFIGEEEEKA